MKGHELYVANAGDSRCVLCRDGQAVELSLDHKPEDEPEMERIVKAGGKVTADGRVNGGLNLSRALGDHAYKQNVELSPQEQMISALPDVRHITIKPETDEFMILACDGIWNFMSSQDVVQFIRTRLTHNNDKLSKICEEVPKILNYVHFLFSFAAYARTVYAGSPGISAFVQSHDSNPSLKADVEIPGDLVYNMCVLNVIK